MRAIGSLGLMMLQCTNSVPDVNGGNMLADWKMERTCLLNLLDQNGIPFAVASQVADEIGSIEKLKDLYKSIPDDTCRSNVLEPIFRNLHHEQVLHNSPIEWSAKILRAFEPKVASTKMESHQDNIRTVQVQVPHKFQSIFDKNTVLVDSFYNVNVSETHTKIPTISIQTTSGLYKSNHLNVSILEGKDILCYAKASLISQKDCAKAAVMAGQKVRDDLPTVSQVTNNNNTNVDTCGLSHPMILIVRGMSTSVDQEARMNGFRPELRVLGKCD
jgi:hypothetical protein